MNIEVEVFTVLAPLGGAFVTVDAIGYAGKLWLVPEWLEAPGERRRTPLRMIRFDHVEHRALGGAYPHRYSLSALPPTAVLDGSSSSGHEILQAMDIPFSCPMPAPGLN